MGLKLWTPCSLEMKKNVKYELYFESKRQSWASRKACGEITTVNHLSRREKKDSENPIRIKWRESKQRTRQRQADVATMLSPPTSTEAVVNEFNDAEIAVAGGLEAAEATPKRMSANDDRPLAGRKRMNKHKNIVVRELRKATIALKKSEK